MTEGHGHVLWMHLEECGVVKEMGSAEVDARVSAHGDVPSLLMRLRT